MKTRHFPNRRHFRIQFFHSNQGQNYMQMISKYRVMLKNGFFHDTEDWGEALTIARAQNDRYNDGFATHIIQFLRPSHDGLSDEESQQLEGQWCRIGVPKNPKELSRVVDENEDCSPSAILLRMKEYLRRRENGLTTTDVTIFKRKLRRLTLSLNGTNVDPEVKRAFDEIKLRKSQVELVDVLAKLGFTSGAVKHFHPEITDIQQSYFN